MIPRRRMSQFQRSNRATFQTDDAHQDGTLKRSILSKQIIPDLAVAVNCTTAVNVDVFAAEFEEGGGVLEDDLEGVVDPVVCVVGELDCAGDIFRQIRTQSLMVKKICSQRESSPRSMFFNH